MKSCRFGLRGLQCNLDVTTNQTIPLGGEVRRIPIRRAARFTNVKTPYIDADLALTQ